MHIIGSNSSVSRKYCIKTKKSFGSRTTLSKCRSAIWPFAAVLYSHKGTVSQPLHFILINRCCTRGMSIADDSRGHRSVAVIACHPVQCHILYSIDRIFRRGEYKSTYMQNRTFNRTQTWDRMCTLLCVFFSSMKISLCLFNPELYV